METLVPPLQTPSPTVKQWQFLTSYLTFQSYKMLMKEITDDTKRWKDIPCSWIGRISIVKLTVLLKTIYRFNAIPIKSPMVFLIELEPKILQFVWRHKRPRVAKGTFFLDFLVWTIFKVVIEFFTVLLLFYVLVFGHKACGILTPWPGIEPTPPALEGEVLTTGLPGKSQGNLEKEKWSWKNQAPWLQTILQSNSNQNNMVLAQK